jgi:hypothetical protein
MLRCLRCLGGATLGIVLGLIAAPVGGALIGLVFGSPWVCEPGPFIEPGLQGAMFGAMWYGVLGCIPAALLGGIIGGVVAAKL